MADFETQLKKLLEITIKERASDLHLSVDYPPVLRIADQLIPLLKEKKLSSEDSQSLAFCLMTDDQRQRFLREKEIDFSYNFEGKARFRINIFFQKGYISSALRLIPFKIRTIEELNLPPILHLFARANQGFVLICGPSSQGKSTTLATLIDEINHTRAEHVITIEDPIEYVFHHQKAIVSQREIRADTHSWQIALRSCLREDPDVVMIGEMRDYETIAAALTIAETGHLVFATLHTNSASQTIDRIIDVFPANQQAQIKTQLASVLEAVLSQRLLPSLSGGRIPAVEILVNTPAVANAVREGKIQMLETILQTSSELGTKTLEMDLAQLVKKGKVSLETARAFALKPEELMRLTKNR